MSVKTNQYSSPLSQDTGRGPSNSIWADCPLGDLTQYGPGGIGTFGTFFHEDFLGFPNYGLYNGERQIGMWDVWLGNDSSTFIGTGADTTNLPLEGGVCGFKGGATAIDITATAGLPAYRFISPATGFAMGGKLWMEARVAVSTATTAFLDFFAGLMSSGDAGTRITSAASLCFSATNTLKTTTSMGACLGFWKRATTNPTDWAAVFNVNNGTVQLPSSGVAATSGLTKILTNSGVSAFSSGLTALSSTSGEANANSFVKLGIVYDPTPSCPTLYAAQATTSNQTAGSLYSARVRYFLNGQQLPWFLNTADVQASTFPSSWLVPTIGYRSGGTGAGVGYCDWIRVAQLGTF